MAAQPLTPVEDRINSLDIIRGLALFGVLIINLVREFRVSIFEQFLPASPASPLDNAIDRFLSTFVEMKAFAVFSLLFGIGLAIQYERIARREPPLRLLIRRLLVLLAFGLMHLCLIWNGDILTEYALAGFVVLPCLFLPTGAAVAALLLCIVAKLVAAVWISFPPADLIAEHAREATNLYAHVGYPEYVRYSLSELRLILPLHVWVFPRTVALFLMGVLAWRRGFFSNPYAHRKALFLWALGGISIGVLVQETSPAHYLFTGTALPSADALSDSIAEILLGTGYIATTICLIEFTRLRPLLAWAAPLGRMAFTNYIVQSLVFGWIFFGYGLGLFGRLTISTATMLGIAVYVLQGLISHWWLRHCRFGPLEWLWRSLMYGQRQLMTR